MPPTGLQSHNRKTLAVKRADGEPLTRVDLQYDMLRHIFSDPHVAFTDPFTTIRGDPAGTKVTFRDLYVNALIHSPRCSKASRDKIREVPEFGNEFAMISLLSNVGRINTTMAFFPEMKTALRTYHPVPALQKTNGNLQDAPRIKNILKSCFLQNESQGTVSTPTDVLSRSKAGSIPPTSIVNLIFVFASHATAIAKTHIEPASTVDFLDFFTPVHVSSASRARAFLWLCYHYHEAPSPNPFSNEHTDGDGNHIPPLEPLTAAQAAQENVDSAEENQRGLDMAETRQRFLDNKAKDDETGKDDTEKPKPKAPSRRSRAKPKEVPAAVGSASRHREFSPAESIVSVTPSNAVMDEDMLEGPGRPPARLSSPLPQQYTLPQRHRSPTPPRPPARRMPSSPMLSPTALPRPYADPYVELHPHRLHSPPPPIEMQHSNGKPTRTRARKSRAHPYRQSSIFVTEPRPFPSSAATFSKPAYSAPRYIATSQYVPRTMLEQAWHVSMETDPLGNSDDEGFDENTRLDYILRLRIINRLRGKEPTPERDMPPVNMSLPHAVYGAR